MRAASRECLARPGEQRLVARGSCLMQQRYRSGTISGQTDECARTVCSQRSIQQQLGFNHGLDHKPRVWLPRTHPSSPEPVKTYRTRPDQHARWWASPGGALQLPRRTHSVLQSGALHAQIHHRPLPRRSCTRAPTSSQLARDAGGLAFRAASRRGAALLQGCSDGEGALSSPVQTADQDAQGQATPRALHVAARLDVRAARSEESRCLARHLPAAEWTTASADGPRLQGAALLRPDVAFAAPSKQCFQYLDPWHGVSIRVDIVCQPDGACSSFVDWLGLPYGPHSASKLPASAHEDPIHRILPPDPPRTQRGRRRSQHVPRLAHRRTHQIH